MNEVIDDIRTMTANTGPVKITFYCPLVGTIEDDEGLSSSVGGRFLHSYQWAIEEAIDIDSRSDDVDMSRSSRPTRKPGKRFPTTELLSTF